jgi:hypothetical protein
MRRNVVGISLNSALVLFGMAYGSWQDANPLVMLIAMGVAVVLALGATYWRRADG